MIVETAYLCSVIQHEDGRVTMQRAMPREGIFLHIQFTERELEALRRVLDSQAKPC
jgi:hypothetical protein